MYILAIETTGAFASVALLQGPDKAAGLAADAGVAADTGATVDAGATADAVSGPRILGVIHGSDRYSHLQNLTPQISQILQDSALQIGDIGAIAVSHGPGSFTGIRIGVSTARALAQILDIPCIAVSSLEALALRASAGEAANPAAGETAPAQLQVSGARTLICPILDARRKQVYGAAYELTGTLTCRIQPASCLMTDFLEKLSGLREEGFERICFIGDGIDTCGELIGEWPAFAEVSCAPKEVRYQDAAEVALRGWQLLQEGKTCGYMELQPEYLRMAEAEKKLRDKMAAEKK